MTQKSHRRKIDVGPAMSQVSPAVYWYRKGFFRTKEQARGAFELAYQQGMDGMGASVEQWMGFTEDEFAAWMANGTLPALRPARSRHKSSR